MWKKVLHDMAAAEPAIPRRDKDTRRARSRAKAIGRKANRGKKSQRNRARAIPSEASRKASVVRHAAMVKRGERKSKARTKKEMHGLKTPRGTPRPGERKKLRARDRALRNARMSAQTRFPDMVKPTVIQRDSAGELLKLRQQLQDELSKGGRANQFLVAGLRARIAELSAETGTPKI
ncbi:MAG: hypothetical protein OXI30_14830, partial [Chloroflexota bacterium]|nr:hypothetical protein [Chloroflexota bacterium]